MVRKEHKILCLILCLALIMTTVLTGAFTVFAATEDDSELAAASAAGDIVYCKPMSGWSTVYCYMWNGSGETKNADWPGAPMTKSGDEYYYNITGSFSSIIFNNGSGGNGNQTGNLTYPGNNMVCDASTGQWTAHSGGNDPTNPQPVTQPDPGTGTLVYLKAPADWTAPCCYMWNSGTDNNGWPGAKMTSMGDGIWMHQASKTYSSCIFNPGGEAGKTADLTAQNGKMYNLETSQWEDPTIGDLRISSFTADPESDVYTGTTVNLTASATSKAGDVSYRFSVKNAAGSSSEIAGFSSVATAEWTPTQAGTYTLTLDVKDTAGNEGSKSLSITVQSDAGITRPIIKNVLPANLNLVKKNANTTISVTAGGGQTGTNLLFYKYVVSDPNGVENTPYYTLNNTYNYTFTKLGTYTVNVFVQASDNTVASRTYTYTVTDSDIPEPTVRPTTPTPTQAQPTTAKPTQPVPTTVKPTNPKPTDPVVTVSPTTNPSGYKKGDANQDGYVDIKDATYIQMHVAEYAQARTIDKTLADMDNNGKITVADATLVQILIAS